MAAKITDVAARAGVSVGTVSNVLNGRAKVQATIDRVQTAIEALGYIRNDAARQLRAGRSRTIALVVHDVANPFFTAMARGAEARAAEDGFVVLVGSSGQDSSRQAAYVDLFREQHVAGALITPADADRRALHGLVEDGIPVVLVDEPPGGDDVSSVWADDVEGGYLAVAHLLSQGCKRVLVVAGPTRSRQVANRLAGARRAVKEVHDATLKIHETDEMTVLAGRAVGEQLILSPERPDAVFATNDLLAIGILQSLTMQGGIRVPDDIALIGYDDIDFAAATVVPLSSIRQPATAMGYTAVDLLLRQMDTPLGADERDVSFQPNLVERASSLRRIGADSKSALPASLHS